MAPPRLPPAKTRMAVTFGDIAGETYMLKVACKCGRAGQYKVASLIAKYGADHTILDWLAAVSADCPRRSNPAHLYYDRCDPLTEKIPFPG
jgi:hypothetical protein